MKVLTVNDGTPSFAVSPTFGTTEVQCTPADAGGVVSISGTRGITVDNTDPANPIVGLPVGPAGGLSASGVPLAYNASTDSWGPAQAPFLFAGIQATNVVPNNQDANAEVSLRCGGGFIGMDLGGPTCTVFAPLGATTTVGCNGDGTSTKLQATNTAALQATIVEVTLTGESSNSPSLGFFGAPPVVQPTIGGSRGGNAALASLLTALENMGLIIDGTTA